MHRMKRKSLTVVLAVIMLLSLLAACGKSSIGNSNTSPSANKESAAPESSPSASPEVASEPITITTAGCILGTEKFKEGETLEDNVTTRWAKEELGIEIKYLWTTSAEQCVTKLRLSLSSNEPLPDVLFTYTYDLVADLIEAGKLMDLKDVFNQYASEDFKKTLEDPSLWMKVIKDGGRYAIPMVESKHQNEPVLWLREDWMKKFDLQAPKTLDDLEVIMDKFVNGDPDGNKKKDTVGISMGIAESYNQYMSDASWVFGAYGAMPGYFIEGEDGKLTYGSIAPGAKDALARLRSWMEKGYIHKEALTQGPVQAAELMNTGNSGVGTGPHWMADWPIQDVAVNSPGAIVKAYPLPAGPDGKVGRRGADIDNAYLLVNKDFKHPEALFRYLNKLFEGQNKVPGSEFENGFFEGYDYVMKDGKPFYEDENRIDLTRNFITVPPRDPYLEVSTFRDLAQGKKPETAYQEALAKRNPAIWEAAALSMDMKNASVYNLDRGMPTKTMAAKWDYLQKLEKEFYSKVVMGETSIDQFDQFVEKWLSSGGADVIKEVTERYEANKNS
ncbi:extracellular solute-binding protein [Paenibacillus sp. IITD108]|uniref:extracellular solute-binding protein n=1 Tax=Paenibacillus sp. IITD108 TaxID=3116649 RepID=UPI002F3F6BF5